MDTGIWEVCKPIPKDTFGFIYEITNLTNNRKYIGKKQMVRKIRRKPLKGKKRKRIDYIESDWKTYTGSSDILNEDIKVRKNKQGLMGSKPQVHKDKKKESSKKLGRKKVKEEDENTVGGGALGPTAAAGYGNTVSGTPGTDAYAPGDYRKPVALGAMYSRFGKVGKKRKTRKRKNKK